MFDVRTVVYLRRGDHPPELDEDASTALHHAHLAYLGELVARGIIAANGPLLDQSDPTMRGMSVYTVPVDEAQRLAEFDPAVRAGRFRVDVARWCVAGGRGAIPHPDGPVGERGRVEDREGRAAPPRTPTSPPSSNGPGASSAGTSSARMRRARSPSTRTSRGAATSTSRS